MQLGLQVEPTSAIPTSAQPVGQTVSVDKSRRIEFLDVLRGIASLLVVIQHTVERASPQFSGWTTQYMNFGETGVVVFFIVSGFIIPVSLEKYNALTKFWLGRVLRLWPIFTLSLIVMLVVNLFVPVLPEYFHQHPLAFVAGNLSMLAEAFRVPLALGTYWTLSLELVFYVLCSVLFLFGVLRATTIWLWLSAALLLIAEVGFGLTLHRTLPVGRLGLLVTAFFGTLLFRYLAGHTTRTRIAAVLPVLLVVFATCFWLRYDIFKPLVAPLTRGSESQGAATCAILSWVLAYAIFLSMFALRMKQFPRA